MSYTYTSNNPSYVQFNINVQSLSALIVPYGVMVYVK